MLKITAATSAARRRLLAAMSALALGLTGCAREAILERVTVEPDAITPNADGITDAARISYDLRRTATVSIYLLGRDDSRHYFRQDALRSPGQYAVDFAGVVDGRMLPDGEYLLVVEATPTEGGGGPARAEAPLTISQADVDYPEIIGLSVFPDTFSPDRDGIGDRVRITYDLSKEVTRVSLFLEGPTGERFTVPEDKLREFGAVGRHEHDYDGGIDLGAVPPAAGNYRVILEVEDAAGNKARAETSLTIESGGVPRAAIVKSGSGMGAEWSATVVPLGEVLTFTLTVRNIGPVPIRTHGPEPGTVYDNNTTYNTLGAYISSGAFRIGVNYQGNSAGDSYPYRWQLGPTSELTVVSYEGSDYYYLMPNQVVTVTGGIRMVEAPPRQSPRFWVGLIHEDVQYVPGEDYVNPTAITIGA